jgi:DNA-binding LacI/PurR family transcriptional regulator
MGGWRCSSPRQNESPLQVSPRATIRDVAREAGVSLGTASRVVNGVPNVSAAVRARVEQAIARLGYKPDPQAQGLRGGATRTVGIIVRDITIPALAGFVRTVQDTVLKAGYTLLITCSEDRPEREIELLSLMAERRVDGVIMTTCSEADPELAAAREALSLPLVMLDRKTKLPGILRSLRVRNMRVGEDISVIGTADSDLATLSLPAISVIRWSYPELGRTCARLLLEQIEADGKFEPREILYPTEFLIRQSCTAPQQR